jgi:hypothetical protein
MPPIDITDGGGNWLTESLGDTQRDTDRFRAYIASKGSEILIAGLSLRNQASN